MSESTIQYQELDAAKILKTINTLSNRVHERFPESSLYKVSQRLLSIAQRTQSQVERINQPNIWLRTLSAMLIAIIIIAIWGTLTSVKTSIGTLSFVELIQLLESAINDAVLIAVAIFFLTSLETRFKRHKALKSIHELRAIAHIIDMHQLTKDPVRMHWVAKGVVPSHSELTPFLLTRYLDYCSEMLSLVSKVSVLYVQKFDDPIALSAVNEVESLTTSLSRKIWQKLMIIHDGIKLSAQ